MSGTPPFGYFGGKQRIAKQVVALLPRHDHYVEPFAGSLSVLLAKRRSAVETVNDLNGDLMTFWRVLRDQPVELASRCDATPHSRAEFEAALDRPSELDDMERARRVWVALTQGRSSALRRTGWRFNVGTDSASMPTYVAGYRARLLAAADRIERVSLENRPALEVVAQYGASPGACLYVDPPYLSSVRAAGGYGASDMGSDDAHRDLAAALHECNASVVLSGYASPLYDELYADWSTSTITAHTSQGGADAERPEVLWSNRAFPADEQGSLFEQEAS